MLQWIKAVIAAYAFSIGAAGICCASIGLQTDLTIDFKNPADAKAKADWSPADKLEVTPTGLGRNDSHWGNPGPWIETKPFPLGLSWRTASAASIRVTVDFLPRSSDPATTYSYEGAVFVRYGPDAKNWSSWQALERQPADTTKGEARGIVFRGEVGVPYRESEAYHSLVSAYSALDVPWPSDEEAAVKWIVAKDPAFFRKHLSFVGYIEFLFETNFEDDHQLARFEAEMGVGLGGLSLTPKDPSAEKDRGMDVPWRYRAP